jgi:hypothetical protein
MTTTRRDFLTAATAAAGAAMTGDLSHANAQGHDHEHQAVPSDLTLRVKALESLLVEKGLVDRAALDTLIDTYEHKIGPRNGARVVARAWVDPAYKQRLLADANAAIAELGYGGQQGEHMQVVENLTRAECCVSSASNCRRRRRCAFGTAPPNYATLSFPSGRLEAKD